MPDSSDLHAILVSLSPAIIAFLRQRGFFELAGPYDPADILPLGLQSTEWASFMRAAKAKNTRIWEILKRRIPDDIREGAAQVAEDYGLVKPKSVKAYADLYIRKHGGELITNMCRTDQRAVVKFVWANAGMNERPMAKVIAQQPHIQGILDTGKHRTETIIRTEKHRAVSWSAQKYAQDNKFKENTWHTAGDQRVRAKHKPNNGVTVKIGDVFPSGERYPGENSINCRCYLSYR